MLMSSAALSCSLMIGSARRALPRSESLKNIIRLMLFILYFCHYCENKLQNRNKNGNFKLSSLDSCKLLLLKWSENDEIMTFKVHVCFAVSARVSS